MTWFTSPSWNTLSAFILLYLTHLRLSDTSTGMGLTEFCQWEDFNATCGQGEVVMMTAAHYGRMAIGRCVGKNYGYVGCSIDVLNYIDTVCSGKRVCKLNIPDENLRARKPCPKDFTSYFEAAYKCVKVETGSNRRCSSSPTVNISGQMGFLASAVTAETGLGSTACPWIITVDPGQRINVTLMDFSLIQPFGPNDVLGAEEAKLHTFCHKYAAIHERPTTRGTVVCGGEQRYKNVFVSSSNRLEIGLMRYNSPKKSAYFLLQYEAIGCPVMQAPRQGWLEQDGDTLVVGCNTTKERWYMKCNGRNWMGEMRDCVNHPDAIESVWYVLGEDWSSPVGILVVTALGVALGLVIGAIMLASVLFCLKRRRRLCGLSNPQYPDTARDSEEDHDDYAPYCKNNSHSVLQTDQMELVNLNPDSNYGAMWKARPPSNNHANHVEDHPNDITMRQDNSCLIAANKLAPMSTFRPPESHVYESPKFSRRDFMGLGGLENVRDMAVTIT